MAHSFEDVTVSCSEASSKNVPLQVDLLPLLSKDEGSKLRRPVRPIDRQRMRPWLMELLDLGNVFGLRWTDRRLGIFQISWRHASRLGWNLETDGDVFERWAKHTGIYKEGDPPEPKRWKANFRCALHSLHDVVDLTVAVERRGRNACRTYRFLQSNDDKNTSRKRAKARRSKEFPENPQQTFSKDGVPMETVDSCTDEEIVSHTEFEVSPQDKVIVQKLDMKQEILVEEFCLHHDHDYAGPDKTHKTIVFRQGVGSIVLHKEIHSAPEAADEVENLLISNLDQLASAAVNSVGIESIQPQEFNNDSANGKASTSEKSVVEMPELSLSDDFNVNQSYFNLKYMPEETNILGDSAISSNNFTRKRKSVTAGHESFIVSVAESDTEIGDVDTDVCSFRMSSNDSPSASLCPRPRASSPKILCRKPKRSKASTEKNALGPSEPLMSSCLLLLEAATRLDNAEKTGVTSLSSKLQAGKQNVKTSPGFQHHEFSSTESQMQNDSRTRLKTSTHELPKSFELPYGTSKSNHTEHNRQVTSFGILRTTLENSDRIAEFTDNVHTFKTKHLKEFGKSSVNSSEVKVIVNDEPFATGLFSGSKIEPRAPLSFIWNKHDNNKEGVTLSQSKVSIQKQNQPDGDCVSASVSDKSTSETLSSFTCNMSAVKPGRVIQKLVIKRVFPVMDAAQKKTFSSECDFSSDISDAAFDDNCYQIYVSAEGVSQKLAEMNTGIDQIRSVHEFSDSCLSSPSHHRVNEHMFSSSSNNSFCRSDSSKTPLTSSLNDHDICFDNSSGTKTYTVTTLPSSHGSVTVSPPPVRTVTFTATSCHTVEVLPIYSQAEIKAASKSSDLHLSGCQNSVPSKTDSVIASSYILSNCPANSTEPSLLLMQDKDVFIIEPRKQVVNDIAFTVVSTSASSSVAPTKLSAEVNNVSSAGQHGDRTSQRSLDSGIHEIHETKQDHSQRVSDLLKPGVLTSTCRREEETAFSVVMNETTVPVSDIDLSSSTHSEMLDNMKSLDSEDVLCELIATSCEKTPQHMPGVYSCSFRTFKTEDVTHSDVVSHDTSKTVLHYSCNKPLEFHTSVSSNYQALGTNRNEDKPLQIKHSFSLAGTDKIGNVQSLAQLCKTYVAHLFTTLDNQASESDENDSVTESPHCELKDEKQEMNYLAHAVTLQQKLSSFKSGVMWQDVGSTCQHSGNNVTGGIKVPGENTDSAVSPRSLTFQSQSTVTANITSTGMGMICSGEDCLTHIQEHSLNSANSSSLPQAEQASGDNQQPNTTSNVGVGTSSASTATSSVDTSPPITADVSSISMVTSPPVTADVSSISIVTSPPMTVDISNLSIETSFPATVDESQIHDNSGLPMDPVAATCCGEVTVFASN